MHWKIKASIQKLLAISNIGNVLNHIPPTLKKTYHQNVFIYQFYECIRKFEESSLELVSKQRIALEIGTGYSIISEIILFLLGFEQVITIDISKDINYKSFKKQIKYINNPKFRNILNSKSKHNKNSLDHKIDTILTKKNLNEVLEFCNIEYIPNYTFEDIEKRKLRFDYINSQVVLEHIPPMILDSLFSKQQEWLSKEGIAVHTINFIDHYANPGLFQDCSISEFNFLKFSDKEWDFWSGNEIAYTNRLSYIYYIDLCKKYDLKIIDFKGENYRVHNPINTDLIHKDVLNKYRSDIKIDDIQKYQRGTLVFKH